MRVHSVLTAYAVSACLSAESHSALALAEQAGTWHLQPTPLLTYVDESGALTDIRSSVTNATLILNDTRLRPGTVAKSLPVGDSATCFNDPYAPRVFRRSLLNSGGYRLECRGLADGRYSLQLSAGKRSQMLPGADPASGSWQLLWAGDLDRDGKPDLVSEYSNEGGYCQQVLLSATAGAEQLLAPGEPHCLAD